MSKYRVVVEDGQEQEVLGEVDTEDHIDDKAILVLKGDDVSPDQLRAFRESFEQLNCNTPIMIMPSYVEVKHIRFEEIDNEGVVI